MALKDATLILDTLGTKEKKKATYADGTVMSVRGNMAYVNIDGGAQKTPCQLAMSAKVGDKVRITIVDHTASVTGNYTEPATSDVEAVAARKRADAAFESAQTAHSAAQNAEASAEAAASSAASAAESAASAAESAASAAGSAAIAEQKAQEAIGSADTAKRMAQAAQKSADAALESATDAMNSSTVANNKLSDVEQVVGTLNWISEHGRYLEATETEPVEDRIYYTRSYDSVREEYVYKTVGEIPPAYELTTDTAIDPDKTYYRRVYSYAPTSDTDIDPDKTYYRRVYSYALTTDTDIDPDKTYYRRVYSYALTTDTEIVEGKTYYQLVEGEYVAVENPVVEDIGAYYERIESYTVVESPVVEDISNYYERSESYVPVEDPVVEDISTYYERFPGNPSQLGYWYLVVNESVQNYIATHVGLTNNGLMLTPSGNQNQVLVSSGGGTYDPGVYIWSEGKLVGYYGKDSMIGDQNGAHITVGTSTDYSLTADTSPVTGKTYYTRTGSGTDADPYVYEAVEDPSESGMSGYYEAVEVPRIGLWNGSSVEAAWITNNELHIRKTVVLDEMQIGYWKWVRKDSGNLRLMWIGA